jgi:polar amino acid transport system ATP-binding protein
MRRARIGGLTENADVFSGQLSRRPAAARSPIVGALAIKPKLMLFDEVTSALDPELVREVLDARKRLVREGMTMRVVDPRDGLPCEVPHRIVFMDGGRVVEAGSPGEMIDQPQNPRTQAFLSKILWPVGCRERQPVLYSAPGAS